MQALCLAARGGILSWSKNIHFSLSRRPGWTDFSAQGLHMRNVKCCISLKSLPYALDDEEPLIPFFLSFF